MNEEKNIIYAMSLVGVLLFLIIAVGGIYNMTGAGIVEPPTRVAVTEDMTINSDTTLTGGPYNFNDAGGDGVIIINASNIELDCNNVVIYGSNLANSIGIYSSGKENITIKNCDLSKYDTGIHFDSSIGGNTNVTVNSHTIYDVVNGIYLEDVVQSFVYSNEIYNASSAGITCVPACTANDIYSNTIYDSSGHGINISDVGNSIRDNTIYNTGAGSTYSAIVFSANGNIIKDNNITDDGIQILTANQSEIINNRITNPEDNGIYLSISDISNITGNIITGTGCVGINFTGSTNNTVYNNVVDCSGGINAEDSDTNFWNISNISATNIIGGANQGGNFWGDYSGNDTNNDGIGDTGLPYNSTTITNDGDYLPLICLDADGDGYSPSPYYTEFCGPQDCNDGNPAVNPGATEVCGDGIDNDCVGGDVNCPSSGDGGRPTSKAVLVNKSKEDVPILLPTDGILFVVIPESQVLKDIKIELKQGKTIPKNALVETQVKNLDSCSEFAPGKTLFSCLDVSSNILDSDIERVTLNYKVPNVLLASKRIDMDTFFALRNNEKLVVSERDSDDSFTYVEVISPGLSTFAMAGDSIPELAIEMRPLQIALIFLAISAVMWILMLGWQFKHKPKPIERRLPWRASALHRYINASKRRGFGKKDIKKSLVKAGWTERHVIEELKKFFD